MKKSATEPCRLWIRPSPCWTAAQRVTTAAGYYRFSLMQSGVLHPCQGRSGEDGAGQQSLYQYPSKLLCAKVWGSVCISLIRPVFLTSFHHSVAIRKRKTNPCGISSTGKTQPSSEVKTFLQDWPQVLKQKHRAVREGRKTVTTRCGLICQAATAARDTGVAIKFITNTLTEEPSFSESNIQHTLGWKQGVLDPARRCP